jgi:type II secretory pathway component GspD/PulD (secretin)
LKVHAEASTTVPGVTVLGGAVFDTRAFLTDLRAKDGETLILGGIIQKQVSDTLRKTPFFGDIPGLGWAFKKKDKTTHTVELMVFLRPRVVRNSEDARELMREMDQKAPLIKKWDDDSAQQSKDQQEKEKKKK